MSKNKTFMQLTPQPDRVIQAAEQVSRLPVAGYSNAESLKGEFGSTDIGSKLKGISDGKAQSEQVFQIIDGRRMSITKGELNTLKESARISLADDVTTQLYFTILNKVKGNISFDQKIFKLFAITDKSLDSFAANNHEAFGYEDKERFLKILQKPISEICSHICHSQEVHLFTERNEKVSEDNRTAQQLRTGVDYSKATPNILLSTLMPDYYKADDNKFEEVSSELDRFKKMWQSVLDAAILQGSNIVVTPSLVSAGVLKQPDNHRSQNNSKYNAIYFEALAAVLNENPQYAKNIHQIYCCTTGGNGVDLKFNEAKEKLNGDIQSMLLPYKGDTQVLATDFAAKHVRCAFVTHTAPAFLFGAAELTQAQDKNYTLEHHLAKTSTAKLGEKENDVFTEPQKIVEHNQLQDRVIRKKLLIFAGYLRKLDDIYSASSNQVTFADGQSISSHLTMTVEFIENIAKQEKIDAKNIEDLKDNFTDIKNMVDRFEEIKPKPNSIQEFIVNILNAIGELLNEISQTEIFMVDDEKTKKANNAMYAIAEKLGRIEDLINNIEESSITTISDLEKTLGIVGEEKEEKAEVKIIGRLEEKEEPFLRPEFDSFEKSFEYKIINKLNELVRISNPKLGQEQIYLKDKIVVIEGILKSKNYNKISKKALNNFLEELFNSKDEVNNRKYTAIVRYIFELFDRLKKEEQTLNIEFQKAQNSENKNSVETKHQDKHQSFISEEDRARTKLLEKLKELEKHKNIDDINVEGFGSARDLIEFNKVLFEEKYFEDANDLQDFFEKLSASKLSVKDKQYHKIVDEILDLAKDMRIQEEISDLRLPGEPGSITQKFGSNQRSGPFINI